MKKFLMMLALVMVLVGAGGTAQAGLSLQYQFIGKGNWSLGAVGSNNEPVGNIPAVVPDGFHGAKSLFILLYEYCGFCAVGNFRWCSLQQRSIYSSYHGRLLKGLSCRCH